MAGRREERRDDIVRPGDGEGRGKRR
jgi:hypothetical protein